MLHRFSAHSHDLLTKELQPFFLSLEPTELMCDSDRVSLCCCALRHNILLLDLALVVLEECQLKMVLSLCAGKLQLKLPQMGNVLLTSESIVDTVSVNGDVTHEVRVLFQNDCRATNRLPDSAALLWVTMRIFLEGLLLDSERPRKESHAHLLPIRVQS